MKKELFVENILQITIVEDNPSDADLLVRRLEKDGFKFKWERVENEKEYLFSLQAGCHLVLSDWSLPSFSGLHALQLNKKYAPDTPFIIISGNIGEEAAVEAMRQGASDYIFKDRPERLGQAIHGALEKKRLLDQRKIDLIELKETQSYLDNLLNYANAPIIVWDANQKITRFNHAIERLTGYHFEEVVGKSYEFLFLPENREASFVLINQFLTGNHWEGIEIPIVDYEGKIKIVLWNFANIYEHGSDRIIATIAQGQDITERKHTEELIATQNKQLRMLYEASQRLNQTLNLKDIYQTVCDFIFSVIPNDGFYISAFDQVSQLITCRACWMENKWLEVDSFPPIPLEAEGKGTQSLVIRSGKPLLINDYQLRQKTTKTIYYVNSETNEVEKEKPSDEELTRSAMIVPLKISGCVTGVIQVMSCRLNAFTEDQMKLLEALSLHIASAEQNALLFNKVQEDLKERVRAEEILHHAHIELESLLTETEKSRGTLQYMFEEKRASEEKIRQINKNLEHRIAERTADLEFANKELENFTQSVSHDLRAPIRALEGYTTLLLSDYRGKLDEEGQNCLERIRDSSILMDRLVNGLYELTRISSLKLSRQAVDLGLIAHQIFEELKKHNPNRLVELELSGNLATNADFVLMRLVLENLMSNAYKFSCQRKKAIIEFGVLTIKDECVYFLRDNGIGFDMLKAQKLFSPFQRFHDVMEYEGTGIGLSIVERIITRHGGRIWCDSEVGQGAIFYFTLEAKKNTAPKKSSTKSQQ